MRPATPSGRARSDPYLVLAGVVVGLLVAGGLVPLAVGTGARHRSTVAAEAGAMGSDRVAGGPTVAPGPGATAPSGPGVVVEVDPATGAHSPQVTAVPTDTTRPPGTAGGATDQGVTAERVKVGFLLLQVSSLARVGQVLGVPPPEEQRETIEAYLAEVNDAGGIHGRRLEPAYALTDPVNAETERAACLALTDDADVFAVIGSLTREGAALCVTQEQERPFLQTGVVSRDAAFARSKGRLFSLHQRSGRLMANLVAHLDARGALARRVVGILTHESTDPGGETAEQAKAALVRAGRRVPVVSRLNEDLGVAASQIPVEVNRMQSAGVDLVVLLAAGLVSTQFVQHAERQQYLPAYAASDYGPMSPDTSAQNMPRSFEGAVLVTTTRSSDHHVNAPDTADLVACREQYESHTRKRLTRGTNAYNLTMSICSSVAVFAAGAQAAGLALTARSWSDGLQRAGTVPRTATSWGGGAFAPAKFDMADLIRANRWEFACRCWKPVEPFRPTYV